MRAAVVVLAIVSLLALKEPHHVCALATPNTSIERLEDQLGLADDSSGELVTGDAFRCVHWVGGTNARLLALPCTAGAELVGVVPVTRCCNHTHHHAVSHWFEHHHDLTVVQQRAAWGELITESCSGVGARDFCAGGAW